LPMDALMRSNLKHLLGLEAFFPNALYRNPINTKLIFTYLTGGDVVKIVSKNPNNLRHEVTPDLPTKFNIKGKRVDTVTLGFNNIVVSTSGLDGNGVYAIGNNQFGELGVGSKKTKIHWTQVCKTWIGRIKAMYSSIMATFFLCTDGTLLSSGRWNGRLESVEPRRVEGVNPQWKIKDVSVNDKNLIMIGNAGELAGMGTNSVGELGIRDRDVYPVRLLPFNPQVQNNMSCNGQGVQGVQGQNNVYYPPNNQCQPQLQQSQRPNFTIPPMPSIPPIPNRPNAPVINTSYSYSNNNQYPNNYNSSYNSYGNNRVNNQNNPRFVYTNSNPLFYQ
jgi:alpha-tubulin suppressor-like RCC1 family protein